MPLIKMGSWRKGHYHELHLTKLVMKLTVAKTTYILCAKRTCQVWLIAKKGDTILKMSCIIVMVLYIAYGLTMCYKCV